MYFLLRILPFANRDISRHNLVLDTSVFVKDNMDRREYRTLMAMYVGGFARMHCGKFHWLGARGVCMHVGGLRGLCIAAGL
jgi:hypothetical protein